MKKLILTILMILWLSNSLFANSIKIGTFEYKNGSLQSIIINKSDKQIFLYYIYSINATISTDALKTVERKLTNLICDLPKIKNKVLNGWNVIVTYMYKK